MIDKPQPPSETEANGRTASGRFGKGNKFAKGNPEARKVRRLKHALLKAVSADDIARIARSMVQAAIEGDVQAAKVVLERTIGQVKLPIEMDGMMQHSGGVVFYIPETETELEVDDSPSPDNPSA